MENENLSLNVGIEYIAYCRRRFQEEYLPRIIECLNSLSDEQIWWRPNKESNSAGNLILHLCGNVRQWIICGFGNATDTRNRSAEFSEQGPIARGDLLHILETTMKEADDVLSRFDSSKVLQKKFIQKYELTYLDALSHVVEHFGQHTAQIIYITKMLNGGGVEFFGSYFPQKASSSDR